MKFYYVTNFFDLHSFDGPFKSFWNFHQNAFCFFIFSKCKKHYNLTYNSTTWIVVHYANINSSSINKPYLRAVEYAISFFSFFSIFYVYFNEAFKKAPLFNANFQNSFQDVVDYRILGC